MKERRVDLYISDIIDCIDKILSYIEDITSYEEFAENSMLIDAVTRNFEIIGEVSNKLPLELKTSYPEVPWRQMYGLRNFAIHEYHTVDPRILWEIATEHLVTNKIQLEEILDNLNK